MDENDEVFPGALLNQMPQQEEVRGREDDWTGLTDAAARRKLQNRLNQRIYRRRRQAPKKSLSKSAPLSKGPEAADQSKAENQPDQSKQVKCFNNLSPSGIQELMHQYEHLARQEYALGSPRVDQLLTLIQFNVFRALISNTATLGFSMAWLEEDALSPFPSQPPLNIQSCPSSLHPTQIQRKVPHHPWIDLFPFPRLRDNLLLAEGSYDEYALCNELVDFCDVPNEKTGLIVWGEPWDPFGWEVTSSFLERWGWVVKGCEELSKSTNYWRAKRGEGALVVEV
jgi:hypothetical protein